MKTSILRATVLTVAILAGGSVAVAAPAAKSAKGPGYGFGLEAGHGLRLAATHDGGYSGRRAGHRRHGGPGAYGRKTCLWPHEIRRKLRRHGWVGIRPVRLLPHVFVAHAKRYGGGRYKLRVNRCRGHVVSAKRLGHGYWY